MMMLTPTCSSPSSFSVWSTLDARSSATPPPGTMPSSTAALVACIASSTRAFFSFISVSVAAPDLDDRHPAHQLGESLLQLLAVVVGRRVLDLRAQLFHATVNRRRRPGPLDDRRVVLVDGDLLRLAEVLHLDGLEL